MLSHYWLGDSWSDVAWLATALAVVWIAVQEALDNRARRRAGQQGD